MKLFNLYLIVCVIVYIPCDSNPCNGGTCQYYAGSYICYCLPGFTGVFCVEEVPSKYTLKITDSQLYTVVPPVLTAGNITVPVSSTNIASDVSIRVQTDSLSTNVTVTTDGTSSHVSVTTDNPTTNPTVPTDDGNIAGVILFN